MHLSSITLQGFKSFADKTTLALEPGVTVIVGPNGSGKSNVVDALTWVLGTQSPRSLRGGAMADVIFAGAPGRAGLGRAAVEITIDNSEGVVPLDFGEITVGRAMFASGETEYTINGTTCRQLDIAELLSDTGLGRESHTIVSQGQLDAILTAHAEERRAFIDEAAGITKHRRRKDRAVRRLTRMSEHAERLQDLARELKRGLRPLERQAEAAARHAELTTQLRSVRIARVTDDVVGSSRRYAEIQRRYSDSAEAALMLQDRLDGLRSEQDAVESTLASLRPVTEQAATTHFRLSNVSERLRSVQTQIAERAHGLQTALDEPIMLRDPAELRKAAAVERERLDALERQVRECESEVAASADERATADRARRAHEQAAAAEARRRATDRERRLRWEGEVAALRSTLARVVSEHGRSGGRLTALREREQRQTDDIAAARVAHDEQRVRRVEHERAASEADAVVAARRAELDQALDEEHDCERRRAALSARVDALEAAAAEVPDGTRGLLETRPDGVVGRLAEQIAVEPGHERAISVALGPVAEAVVFADEATAQAAARQARARDDGRVRLLVAGGEDRVADTPPPGSRAAASLVDGDDATVTAVRRLLGDAIVVDDYDRACALARTHPNRTVITIAGELAGAGAYVVGSTPPGSTVEQQAALLDARQQLTRLTAEAQQIGARVAGARSACVAAEESRAAAVAELKAASVAGDERAEQLRRLEAEAAAYRRELEAVEQAAERLDREVEARAGELEALEAGEHPDADSDAEGPDLEAERLGEVQRAAQDREVEARVALSSAVSRRDEVSRRIAAAEDEAEQLEHAWAVADLRQDRRRAAIERCRSLATVAALAVEAGAGALADSAAQRQAVEQRRDDQQQALGALRSRLAETEREHTDHTRNKHAGELQVAEARHVLDDARARARDLGLEPDTLASESVPIDDQRRTELAEAEERLARQVALLGPVNPLAVNEYEALKERQRFLAEQLDDLDRSRRDLLEMVAAVDDRIREIFSQAFADVATQFERMFDRLFPGGEGRLVLTDPDDLLITGVDVEARPAGKRVKRLSLLSGGERSLVALALAFAIFAARPSPFYVLDEVEAALDDVNLQRVLDVIGEFRSTSQLIVVTHQKRTMEIADVLYGVTMRSGGVSRVLSQRLSGVA